MKQKISVEDVMDLMHGFAMVRQNQELHGEAFSYAIAKNRRKIRDPFETQQEFEEEHEKARKEFVKGLEKQADSEELTVESIIALQQYDQEWNETMRAKRKEGVEMDLHMIAASDLPKKLPSAIYDRIFVMISGEQEKKTEE